MNERDWGRKFREEADEVLFADLVFDERLKAQVRERIRAEEGRTDVSTANAPTVIEPYESQIRSRTRTRSPRLRKAHRLIAAVSAASVAAIAAFSLSGLFAERDPGDLMKIEHYTIEINQPISGDVESEQMETFHTLETPKDSAEATTMESGAWEIADLAEARQVYGADLQLPTFIPDHYEITAITGLYVEDALQINITYASADHSFVFTQKKINGPQLLADLAGEPVAWNGTQGYLSMNDGAAEIRWSTEEAELSISGDLDPELLIQIAASVMNTAVDQ